MIHIHPVNHRSHGNCTTPSLLCCSVRSESGCSHSIDKALLLDATSIDTPQLISLIHLVILAELQQIHYDANMFPGVQTSTLGYLRRSHLYMSCHYEASQAILHGQTSPGILKNVPLRVFIIIFTKLPSVIQVIQVRGFWERNCKMAYRYISARLSSWSK